MHVSFLKHKKDKKPQLYEFTWDDLVSTLSQHIYLDAKDAAPLYSPATLVGGRKLEFVQAVNFGVLDFDDVPLDAFLGALRTASQFDSFAYSTWQHPEAAQRGLVRARLVVPLSRVCSPAEWHAVHAKLVAMFGASADPICKDPTRCYYVPSLPVGCEAHAMTWRAPDWQSGARAFPVDAPIAAPAAPVRELVANDPIPLEVLKRHAANLQKRADPNAVRIGLLIKASLDGYSIAVSGHRDTTLFQIACSLAEAFPTGSARNIAEHFRNALSLMAHEAPDCPTLEQFAEKIERAQKKIHADRAAVEQAEQAQQNNTIAIAFHGERSHAYTPEELEAWCQDGALEKRWIVQRGDSIWIFFDGSYVGPFRRSEIAGAVMQFLAPARTAGVELYEIGNEGAIRVKPLERLIREYGRNLLSVEADLTAQKTHLAKGRHVLVEAPAPLRADLTAEFDSDVAEWLRLLAGQKHEALLDWIATVTWLHTPNPALYLKGTPGAGKGMLAFGLARLWGSNHPTSLRSAMSSFNAEIARCPLVLADEQVPESWNGAPRTEELRELIASTEFSLNRKFQDLVTCKGALRIILCANNLKLISSREEFTPEDAQALADRFLFVVPDPAARDWLQARGGFRFTSSWVEGDRIARHALWLKAQAENHTRPIKPGARFIVPGDANELLAQMRAGSGLRWSILYWIDSFLRDPKVHFQARGGRSSAVLVKDREIWVAPRLLLDGWTHYLLGEKAPTQERLASAMRGLLVPAREARYQPNDGRKDGARYQKLDLAQLLAWYEMTHAELEELASFLEHDTETVFGGPRATVQAN